MFTVVGVGPGNKDLLTVKALEEIEKADILVGGRKHLEIFAKPEKELFAICSKNLKTVIEFIKKNHLRKKLVVAVSGDPGIFSFTQLIIKNFSSQQYKIIPGISSIQYAFTRIKKPWQDVSAISFHGKKNGDITSHLKSADKLCVFGGGKITPKIIGKKLCCENLSGKAIFFENLSLPEEKIVETDFAGLKEIEADSNWLLYLEHALSG